MEVCLRRRVTQHVEPGWSGRPGLVGGDPQQGLGLSPPRRRAIAALHTAVGLRHARSVAQELSVESAEGTEPGWVVRGTAPGEPVLSFATKAKAEAHARLALSTSEAGGTLALHRIDGSLIRRVTVVGTGPAPPRPGTPSPFVAGRNAVTQLRHEGENVDKGLDWGVDLLLIMFGSVLPAFIAPTVLDAAGSGWVAVALATFTWTVGWSAIWFLAFSGRANGAPLFFGAGLALFFVSSSIATVIGEGELTLTRDGTMTLAGIVNNAIDAYGLIGAALGFGIGVWIGSRLARHFPK